MKSHQLSKTAAFIAIKFYGLTRIEAFQQLFDDSVILFYEQVVKNLPVPLCYYHYWLKHNWVRRLYIRFEELFLPGDLLHIIARKWYIRKQITELRNDGFEQIIVLGSGWDDLGFTFTQKKCACFEFEAPLMAKQKRQFLNTCYPGKQHPIIVESYLPKNQISDQITEHPKIDHHKKTIIIAEGFFDYLKRDTVVQMLSRIQNYFSDLTLISTHFALDELFMLHRWSFKAGVKSVGEDLQLNSTIADFRKMVSECDLRIQTEINRKEMTTSLRHKTGTQLSVLQGFYLVVAN